MIGHYSSGHTEYICQGTPYQQIPRERYLPSPAAKSSAAGTGLDLQAEAKANYSLFRSCENFDIGKAQNKISNSLGVNTYLVRATVCMLQ